MVHYPRRRGGWHLQRLIGYQRTAELTFSGRLITAAEALRLGIVLEVVAADALTARAQALAASLAAKPPQALRLSKRLLKSAQRMELAEHLELCAAFQGMCHNTEDHIEALTAVIEKREPRFLGR